MTKRNKTHHLIAAMLLGLSGLVASAPVLAQDNNAVTLNQALEMAYGKNPTLAAERANLSSIDESLTEAYGNALPSIDLQASITHNENITNGSSLSTLFGGGGAQQVRSEDSDVPKSYSATLSQPLFTGGRTINAIRQVKALVGVGAAELAKTEQDVLLDTVSAYMEVLTNRQVVSLNEANVNVLRRQLEAAQDRFEVGEITRTDVSQAEARLAGVETSLISARADLNASEAALTKLTGLRSASLVVPNDLPSVPPSMDEAIGLAMTNNPGILQAKSALSAADAAKDVAVGEYMPIVSLQAQYKRTEDGSSFQQDSSDASISAIASWPIFNGGTVLSRNRQASYDAMRAHHQLVEARAGVEEGVTNAWNNLMATRSAIRSSQSQVSANEVALDGVQQEAEVGVRTTLDVLNAQQELLDSQVTLARAVQNEAVAAYQLLAATGLLNARGLGLNVAIIDPAAADGVVDRAVDYFLGD
ncbi:MAG: TolC family outer membrane protein [Alphaproteobacteria bacterium]